MMTPGPATRTASELPRNNPVPIAPPIAIIPSCPDVSCRESCSPFSRLLWAASVVFISGAGAARRMKNPEHSNRRGTGIFQAVHHAIRQINACARSEFARVHLPFQVQNAVSFENEDHFFVCVQMKRSLAGG